MKYNVTWISNWENPQVFENLSEEEKKEVVDEGKELQYKVVVEEVGFWDSVKTS